MQNVTTSVNYSYHGYSNLNLKVKNKKFPVMPLSKEDFIQYLIEQLSIAISDNDYFDLGYIVYIFEIAEALSVPEIFSIIRPYEKNTSYVNGWNQADFDKNLDEGFFSSEGTIKFNLELKIVVFNINKLYARVMYAGRHFIMMIPNSPKAEIKKYKQAEFEKLNQHNKINIPPSNKPVNIIKV